jgi:hypothetical protein
MVLLLHDAKIPVRKDIKINSMFLFSFFLKTLALLLLSECKKKKNAWEEEEEEDS